MNTLLWQAGFAAEWTRLPGLAPVGRRVREGVRTRLERAPAGRTFAVQEVSGPAPLGRTPWVWRGGAASWPARQRWSLRQLADRFGDDEVLVGTRNRMDAARQAMSLRAFIRELEEGSDRYLRLWPALDRHPELREDLRIDELRRIGGVGRPWHFALEELYIGPAGSSTGLHHVVVSNLFVQLQGEKAWILHPPEHTAALDPRPHRAVFWKSKHDCFAPASGAYRAADRYEVVLGPGDVLWVPPWWWHGVSNRTLSIGLSFWWSGARAAARAPFFTGLSALGRHGPLAMLLGRRPTAEGAAEVASTPDEPDP